jgi:hypothetical protein
MDELEVKKLAYELGLTDEDLMMIALLGGEQFRKHIKDEGVIDV